MWTTRTQKKKMQLWWKDRSKSSECPRTPGGCCIIRSGEQVMSPVSSPRAGHIHIPGLALNQLEAVPAALEPREHKLNHTAICSNSCTQLQVAVDFMLMCQLSGSSSAGVLEILWVEKAMQALPPSTDPSRDEFVSTWWDCYYWHLSAVLRHTGVLPLAIKSCCKEGWSGAC